MHAGQARGQGFQILAVYLVFQRAAGQAFLFHGDGVQLVVLENLGKVVQLARKGHQGKAGQVLVLEHVVVKGGQQLAGFHQGVVLGFLIGLDQAEADVHGIQKGLELGKRAARNGFGKSLGPLPGQTVFAENLLPFDHAASLWTRF